MSVDNPFFHRGAIRRLQEFHGREREISQVLGLLRNGQSVSLIGPRRIGKSSLLLHLSRPEVREAFQLSPPKALFVLVDCQELGGSPPEEVYEGLLIGVREAAQSAGTSLSSLDTAAGSYRALDRAINQIYRQGGTVVFLLDEFELLAANPYLTPYFFARLRGLTTKYGLAYLTASQRPLFEITADEHILSSPFFNIFVTLPLGLYTPEESQNLFSVRLRDTSLSFSPELIAHLLWLVGPHPFFLHIAGYHAFQALLRGTLRQDRLSLIDAPVEIEAESHLSYLWQNLNAEDRYALAIAHGPLDIMRGLEQQCLLHSTEQGYQYTSEMLTRFVRRQDVPGLVQAGPFVIDQPRHQAWANGVGLDLTTSQFDLFLCLCQQAGQVVSSDSLETVVWGEALIDDPDRLKTMIKRLRRAIEPYDNWVVSERGVGYALRSPE